MMYDMISLLCGLVPLFFCDTGIERAEKEEEGF